MAVQQVVEPTASVPFSDVGAPDRGILDSCIHCGLCVRYCAEVRKVNAVGFIDRGIRKEICFIPEIASKECNDCKECFPLCPTSYLQAAFVLAEALAFPPPSSAPASER